MKINIRLFRDRAKYGILTAWRGDLMTGPVRCLGKADNLAAKRKGNPDRNPLKQYGDTPTGTYTGTLGTAHLPASTYGPHPVIMLTPKSGDALKAHMEGGRRGLWIHGGDARNGELRPTFGCIRVDNATQKTLTNALTEVGGECEVVITEEA